MPSEVILASAADVQEATRALGDLAPRVSSLRDGAKAGYDKPLDGESALVRGNDVAGAQLDGLYRVRTKLDRSVQDSILDGQKVRAAARSLRWRC
ncbi:MAG: hypothetical protein HYU66_15885 [Armatimonadetes bacterium]|nr:hypothetical protein [Armatimonadota bacterium]